ncbi:MAG: hypothetical protein R3293_24235 [Candidatus Promineifilaceae bacterium]|nr:hypothetical protein [Candidatus Promineifilaceae bacterium]
MRKFTLLFFLFTLMLFASCRPGSLPVEPLSAEPTRAESNQAGVGQAKDTQEDLEPAAAVPSRLPDAADAEETDDPMSTPLATTTPEPEIEPEEEPAADLALLPPFKELDANGIGDPGPQIIGDLFAETSFKLAAELPEGPLNAVVQEHSFGRINEEIARTLADQFGFYGPLYEQRIPAQYAPPPGEDAPLVLSAFDGRRVLVINEFGLTIEDRGVTVDYNNRPDFATTAPMVESQLNEWALLDFPYELVDLDGTVVQVIRMIDGIPTNQNEFNMLFNHEGQLNYFDYRPLREVQEWGRYPLQTAELAWQQIQTSDGREGTRFEILPLEPAVAPVENFVNPRSWIPVSDPGQELHLYITPAVYEAIDGSGLHLMFGDFTLAGDEEQLAEIAAHLEDVLHVWGTTGLEDGTKTLEINGWEMIAMVNYQSIEGQIIRENGQTLLQTASGESFILPAVPDDIEEGTEVYASVAARRDGDADYPLLDWMSLTEKIEWPEIPLSAPAPEPGPIGEVVVNEISLIYFALYLPGDESAGQPPILFLPVWIFMGETDQNQRVTFWVPAVMPEYITNLES